LRKQYLEQFIRFGKAHQFAKHKDTETIDSAMVVANLAIGLCDVAEKEQYTFQLATLTITENEKQVNHVKEIR